MKRLIAAACVLALACSAVWAGDPAKDAASKPMSAQHAEMMKAEMMKCAVCKHMAAHLDEIGPIQTDVVKLNDGFAQIHNVPPAKAAALHAACDEMSKAGEASLSMTDEQAKTQLCPMCQGIRDAMKAGAHMSQGKTKTGDMMVLTSTDPKVQSQIVALGDKCAMMAAGPQATR